MCYSYRSVCVLKAELNAEFQKHRDLVQGNFIDSYKNLTLKAVLGLRWMSQYCGQAPFAIKTDDDTFLNIFEMVRLMTENANKSRVRSLPHDALRGSAVCATVGRILYKQGVTLV